MSSTARPWKVIEERKPHFEDQPDIEVRDEKNYVVARYQRSGERERKQAAYICTAVNFHDEAKAALETALGFIETQYLLLHKPGRCVTEPPLLNQIKAVLERMNGK